MMLGDINYRDAFLEPLFRDELAYPVLTFGQLIAFTMFVPIVLMNLLVSDVSPLTPLIAWTFSNDEDSFALYLGSIHQLSVTEGKDRRQPTYKDKVY